MTWIIAICYTITFISLGMAVLFLIAANDPAGKLSEFLARFLER